jgi:hypothetical protein
MGPPLYRERAMSELSDAVDKVVATWPKLTDTQLDRRRRDRKRIAA